MSGRFHSLFVNALTFSRVPLIFAWAACAVTAHFRGSVPVAVAACVFMFLAGISDLYDGKLARRWKVVSTFGKLADPLMDKVFFIVSFPTLLWMIGVQGDNVAHGVLMLAFTVLYILRDQWVTFLRAVASSYHADVSAMWLGKVRTALSFPAAGLIYLYLAFHHMVPPSVDRWSLCAVYVVEGGLILLNVYSCVVYTRAYWQYLRRALKD
jgi:CDP-diacylglycerol--glycerol-3-phosphate 3-phosphatidyltransferase